ncbi:MAG: nucleotidyltransferase domain-containing protein [Bacteroidales bacterium]|nr:nucleotidyltransferase domain-containing protein [Bacteroidales bacterium]
MPVAYTKTIRDYFATLPIDKAWVYGSFSRGEERPDSDIDIMVRYSPDGVSLLTHAHIMNTLSDLLGRQVDLVEEDCLLPFAAESANKNRILVYERAN